MDATRSLRGFAAWSAQNNHDFSRFLLPRPVRRERAGVRAFFVSPGCRLTQTSPTTPAHPHRNFSTAPKASLL